FYVADEQVGLAGGAVSDDGSLDAGDDGLDGGLVDTENRRAVKRHAIHELNEGVLNIFERSVLMEMFAVDGGHDGDDRCEHQEAAVAFVSFHDKVFTLPQPGSGSRLIDTSTDDKRGIKMRCR